MFVINNLKAAAIASLLSKHIDKRTTIVSDNSIFYTDFGSLEKEDRPKVVPKESLGKLLSWVHLTIGNTKRIFLDIFHDNKHEYLQSYLNESCYKFNRKDLGENFFDRLLIAGVSYKENLT